MHVIILSVGDELILGQVVDTNTAWLSARLVEAGIVPLYHQTVPDNLEAIAEAVKLAAEKAELVIVSGGLGPTQDDLTRQAVAQAAGAALVLHKPSLEAIGCFFKSRGRPMGASNRVQAMIPKGARALANPIGTAPGFSISIGKALVTVGPGVPREMELMFQKHIAPVLKAESKRGVLTLKINAFGLGESLVGEKLGELMRRGRNPLVGTTVAGGIISIRVRGEFADRKKGAREPALPEMRKTAAEIKRLLGNAVFSEGDVSLAEVVGKMLASARKTVVTAESCTAGLLAAMLTEIPGSSKYFLGGWVVYSNAMKTAGLGVPAELIRKAGAVSEAVACQMAKGALEKAKSDYALAVTGISGPDGGSVEKPVGTVWIALAARNDGGALIYAEKFCFPGERSMVRDRAAKTALNILRLRLLRA